MRLDRSAVLMVALLGLWFVVAVTSLITAIKLKRHRRDITTNEPFTAGTSWAGLDNILNPDNYDDLGKRKVPLLRLGIAVQVVIFLLVAFLLTA